MRPTRGHVVAVGLFVLGLLAVWIMTETLNAYVLTLVSFAGINVMLAVSLNLTNGLTGLFSLGHPAFMAVGGYLAAILTFPASRKGFMLPDLPAFLADQQWSLLPALLAGGVGAAFTALIIGFPVLRLRGHYLAVATLGFIIIVRVLINNMHGYTRGPLGLSGIPKLTDLWWVYLWAALTLFVCWRVKHSSFGRGLMAIRENELAAACVGIRRTGMRLTAFVLGAFFAGIAGGLWAHLVTNLTPTSFSIMLAFFLVVMVVIGGSGSLTGAVVAALGLTLLTQALRPVEQNLGVYGLSQIVIALLLIGILIFRPQGLFGSREPAWLVGPVRAAPRPPAEGAQSVTTGGQTHEAHR